MQPISRPHGRRMRGNQPVVFHCNHYNYWLQKTLRIDPDLGMDAVIRNAAAEVAYSLLREVDGDVLAAATESFRSQGFGTIDFSETTAEGGVVRTPTSHYGQLMSPSLKGERFEQPQNLFDQGFVVGALAAAHGVAFRVVSTRCRSTGGDGTIVVKPGGEMPQVAPGAGRHSKVEVGPPAASGVDEPAIHQALAGLDLSGNEEGFVPRFGVMLTDHFANFYNRISFEFLERMRGSGLEEEAQTLLINAGYQCAFNTFGGIMVSDEWYGVVKPMIRTEDDWVHGMVAVVNTLGWGVWRVVELTENSLTVRIYDDYEASGFHAMYGSSKSPVSFLHMGGVAGLMHLVRIGAIAERPSIDDAFYQRCFEVEQPFTPTTLVSGADADGSWTQIRAERGA